MTNKLINGKKIFPAEEFRIVHEGAVAPARGSLSPSCSGVGPTKRLPAADWTAGSGKWENDSTASAGPGPAPRHGVFVSSARALGGMWRNGTFPLSFSPRNTEFQSNHEKNTKQIPTEGHLKKKSCLVLLKTIKVSLNLEKNVHFKDPIQSKQGKKTASKNGFRNRLWERS